LLPLAAIISVDKVGPSIKSLFISSVISDASISESASLFKVANKI
jgi:hypothetical protein